MNNVLCTLKTLSPLHCGAGAGMNDIDLPVARNKVSGHPVVPGSTIKGVLKEEYLAKARGTAEEPMVEALFGSESPSGSDFASAVSIGDGTLLALPVRSYYGTFAYLASPYTLQLFKEALARMGLAQPLPNIPANLGFGNDQNYKAVLTSGSLLKGPNSSMVLLEDLDLAVDASSADQWAKVIADQFFADPEEKELFKARFAITDDNALNFLSETSLPVDARIRINEDTGTVASGALWYEETVPAETLFFAVAGVDRAYSSKAKKSADEMAQFLLGGQSREVFLQLGGKATTGKGFVRVRFVK